MFASSTPRRPLLSSTLGEAPNPAGRGHTHGGGQYGAAAAVAAGLCDLAAAMDEGGGSARLPAACCGVYAYRATAGVLPVEGATCAATSLASPALLAADPALLARAGAAMRLPGGERAGSGSEPSLTLSHSEAIRQAGSCCGQAKPCS